jgi:hypothetical protein
LAVSGTVGIGSASAAPGAQATVDLSANVPSPGLGAWTVDVTYDSSVVSVAGCTAGATNSVCNPAYTATSLRVTGASAMGVIGDAVLSAITFDCDAEGTSALTLAVTVFADATPGEPTDITNTPSNGTITCAEEPDPTATEEEPDPTALPPTGMGSEGSGGGLSWVIAVLAGAGAAAVAAFGALRLRSRRV